VETPSGIPGQYDKEQTRFTGFIAQEVEQAARSVGYDFSGVDTPDNENDYYGLRYAEFVVPLVKAVQELTGQNETLLERLNAQEAEMEALKAAVMILQGE